MDIEMVEKIIAKGMLGDKNYLVLVSNSFDKDYFVESAMIEIFDFVTNHYKEFKRTPTKDIILANVENKEDVREFLDEVESFDFPLDENHDYLHSETNKYLKERSIKDAIVKSVDFVKNNDYGSVEKIVKEAMRKDLNVNLGLFYYKDMKERFKRMLIESIKVVPTFYPSMDEYLSGGFPFYTLSVLGGTIHGWKSQTMVNFSKRQADHGYNVVIFSLEMSENAYAQRYDSVYSGLDINKMYLGSQRRELFRKLKEARKQEGRGEIYIKQFAPGATVGDFRTYLYELALRDIYPDIIYIDYINIMKPATKAGDNMYTSIKTVAEECRAMGMEFMCPIVSVAQINRQGYHIDFEELGFNYIAESMGIPATADFMMMYGEKEDLFIYNNEIHGKIVKNRLGGRVGDIIKFYYDSRSLKMYDDTEMDIWIKDSEESGDERTAKGDKE